MLNRKKGAVGRARRFRKEMSLPEVLLWQELRRDPSFFHFRRQVPVGEYTLDFYCDKAKLCIEVDGKDHEFRVHHDLQRAQRLSEAGITTLRIDAKEVLANPAEVAEYVVKTCLARVSA